MGHSNVENSESGPQTTTRGRSWLLFWLLAVAPPTLINLFALLQPWTEPKFLYRDPLLLAQNQFEWFKSNPANGNIYCCSYWWGAVSNVGVLVWAATAGVLLLALSIVALRDSLRDRVALFLLLAFLLTALFAIDDLFQFHEQHHLFGPLKGEAVIFPLYMLMFAGYGAFRDFVLPRYGFALGLAIVFFAISLLADELLPQHGTTVVIEDSTKLFGIFFWMAFHVMAAVEAITGGEVFFQA